MNNNLMNTNLSTLFDDLMALCNTNEAFYFVDQVKDGATYRVFTYRLASYTDFQRKNATECRGHTFRKDNDGWRLVSLPMQKFHNYSEHLGWNTEIDLSSVVSIMDKLDGSLISTVISPDGYFLKSKTSFQSQQAVDATKWLNSNDIRAVNMRTGIEHFVANNCTVNFEWISPSNQIVIAYPESRLVALNVRNNTTGEYISRGELVEYFGADNLVPSFDLPNNMEQWLIDAENMSGIEGFVICFNNGLWVKHKTEAYCVLHKIKDSINNARRLWEACILETSDDLRALFVDDPVSIAKIIDMEEKAASVYNHAHKTIHAFYENNKHLDRKSYAILGQQELKESGLFSLAMNLYLGKDSNLKEFLIKHYKDYGISDVETSDE